MTDFIDLLEHKHRYALEHKDKGGLVMGCYSAVVPEELLWACGVLPVQLLMGPGPYMIGQELLPPYVCDCSKSILEQLMDGTYEYLDGIIVPHVCETVRGLAGVWSMHRPDGFVHVFTPPAGSDAGARAYLRSEFLGLAEKLGRLGALPLSMENLQGAVSEFDSDRTLIRELYRMRGRDPSLVSPAQLMAAVLAAGIMPRGLHNRMLLDWMKTLHPGGEVSGIRVILSGLVFENDLYKENALFSILEACNAKVVWDDLAWGMRCRISEQGEATGGDPLDRLIKGLLGPQRAPIRAPSEFRAARLLQAVREYGGQGVIFLVPKYCDPLLFDLPVLTRMLEDNGLPSLCIEISGTLSEAQLRIRLEAFLEMLPGPSEESLWGE